MRSRSHLFCYPVSHYTRNAICKGVCAKIFKSIDFFKDVQIMSQSCQKCKKNEKIQDWFLKYERIRKQIVPFFTNQTNPRSFGLWCIKGTEESTLKMDSSDPSTHHDPNDLGLICLIKKQKISFWIGRFHMGERAFQVTIAIAHYRICGNF